MSFGLTKPSPSPAAAEPAKVPRTTATIDTAIIVADVFILRFSKEVELLASARSQHRSRTPLAISLGDPVDGV
jgi:hypothetical protein